MAPGSVTVTGGAYTFSGTGKITNGTSLTVQSPASLTIANTNDYTLGTYLQGGTIVLGRQQRPARRRARSPWAPRAATARFDLAGYNQTVGGLAVGSGRHGRQPDHYRQHRQFHADLQRRRPLRPPSRARSRTRLRTGGGTLALTVSQRHARLSGGATTYSGATTVNGGPLLANSLPNTSDASTAAASRRPVTTRRRR